MFRDSRIPRSYTSSEEYWDKYSFQDYTDFCVYKYDSADLFKNRTDYAVVTENDCEMLAGYFSDFEKWMELTDYWNKYSFDKSYISTGDYFCIKTKEGQPIGDTVYEKYDNYTVYYFDTETLTLYYIHNNL